MSAPAQQTFGRRVRAAVEAPYPDGERWRRPLIEASTFFTYTFHRQEFEEHLLPELYGLPTMGERSARLALLQLQFSHTHRPVVIHDAHLPVERDEQGGLVRAAALAAPASFRLDTVPVRWGPDGRLCMHAKHILLRVRDAESRPSSPLCEALVVVTASANLTVAGWRQNIELADIQVLRPGQRTSLQPGLAQLLEDAWRWAADSGQPRESGSLSGLAHITALVDSLQPPAAGEPVLPLLWTGRSEPLEDALARAVADASIGPVRHLSAGSPYLTEDASPLRRLVARLQPESLSVLRPHDHQGVPMSLSAWERAVVTLDGLASSATIHALHADLVDPKNTRTTHLKWLCVVGRDGAVLVLGSPNLSDPAFGPHTRPGTNYETAILLRLQKGVRLLDSEPLAPHDLDPSAELDLDPNGTRRPASAPFLLTYDWAASENARARVVSLPGGGQPSARDRIRMLHQDGLGEVLLGTNGAVSATGCTVIHQALDHAPFVELLEAASGPGRLPPLVSIVELNQEHAPVRSRFGLSLDQFLRFVSAASLDDWKQAEREADRVDRIELEEVESQGTRRLARAETALDRPIRIIQATKHLELRARAALADEDEGALGRTLFESGGMSLRSLVDFHLGGDSGKSAEDVDERPDLVDRLVCWLGVRTLIDDLRPTLPAQTQARLHELDNTLTKLEASWDELSDADRDQLKTWLASEWRGAEDQTCSAESQSPDGGAA